MVEGAERIMPREDADAAAVVASSLAGDGVKVVTGREVVAVGTGAGTTHRLRLEDGTTLPYGQLLVAVGRSPRTRDLGLDRAGVALDKRGFVVVDAHLGTTNRRIWAAGDLTGHPAVHPHGRSPRQPGREQRCPGTAPPCRPGRGAPGYLHRSRGGLGRGGHRPGQAGASCVRWDHDRVDRAVAERATSGFTKLVVDDEHRIVGATVVGPRAGESLGELALAIKHGMSTRDLAGLTHPYPTFNDGPWNAALADVRASLGRTPHGAGAGRAGGDPTVDPGPQDGRSQ